MEVCGFPSLSKAMPARTPSSVNLPRPSFKKRKFACGRWRRRDRCRGRRRSRRRRHPRNASPERRGFPTGGLRLRTRRRRGCDRERRRRGECGWAAVRAIAGFAQSVPIVIFESILEVVADVEIEETVGVDVGEGGGHGPAAIARVRCGGDVGELAAVVAKERVASEVRDVEVGVAVIVDVGGGRAHSVGGVGGGCSGGAGRFLRVLPHVRGADDVRRACGVGYATEFESAQVFEERVLRRRLVFRSGKRAAVHEINVQVAVRIEIQKCAARAQDFHRILRPGGAVLVDEVDAAGCGDVGEAKIRGSRDFRRGGAGGSAVQRGRRPRSIGIRRGAGEEGGDRRRQKRGECAG